MLSDLTTVNLGELASFEMGQSPDSLFVTDTGHGIPFLQGSAEFGAATPQHSFYCTKPKKLCEINDVLISVRAPVGTLNKADRVYCIGRGLAAIRFKKGTLPKFGWHLLNYWASELRKVAQGSTFEAIGKTELANSPVIYLPESEQKLIAEILDTIDEAIAHTSSIIAKLKQIKAGLLHDLLTRGLDENGELRDAIAHPEQFKDSPLGKIPKDWEVFTIDNISIYVGSGVTPTGGSDVYQTEGVLFIRSQNVTFDGLLLDDVVYIDHRTHKKMKRSEIFEHDILLNITGASIGRCYPVPEGLGLANVNQHVCAIRLPNPNKEDAIFLSLVLASYIGQSQIAKLNAGGNREGLNYQQIRSFLIPFPSFNERAYIAKILNTHDIRTRTEEAYLEKLKLQKKGLMHDLLTGKIRVGAYCNTPLQISE
ncbi:restriction endonuclease subunit S [Umezakia ovalisporum]|uniref:Restriction endonuclease subunit S n=1 Tax=Umezakia ovalisporum FSS-43 TaxID=2740520 RepID=A0ABT6K4U1_9CYAN|nr:restriction endonuclease subunit S [Umezakia ovalisporum]MDH6057339.1 restriction endonuclease subunit S [Umezakia ovalisporum FSS-43]MDH6065957.1 restriction endonuclease subunit S [Umezakia ovalisporum APH033B]MDH6072521.1 restriction endonuclease subunit S [Umezakia ovalisporum CobakiLakeA]MDH6075586.1 restriction endonuclease subunit S [Umezakia ovalisporum CS-1034]MDH6081056.1 restriction endonuclease subunit S [Umezakia ovalisporum FSS-44]